LWCNIETEDDGITCSYNCRARILKEPERHRIILLAQNKIKREQLQTPRFTAPAQSPRSNIAKRVYISREVSFSQFIFIQPVLLNKRIIDHSSQQSKQLDGLNLNRVPLTNASSIFNLAKPLAMMLL
jgi:hypothetical protein